MTCKVKWYEESTGQLLDLDEVISTTSNQVQKLERNVNDISKQQELQIGTNNSLLKEIYNKIITLENKVDNIQILIDKIYTTPSLTLTEKVISLCTNWTKKFTKTDIDVDEEN